MEGKLGCLSYPIIRLNVIFQVYMFKLDSVYGRFKGDVQEKGGKLLIEGKVIHVFYEKDPSAISQRKAGAQYIVESSGIFTAKEKYVSESDFFSKQKIKNDGKTPQL